MKFLVRINRSIQLSVVGISILLILSFGISLSLAANQQSGGKFSKPISKPKIQKRKPRNSAKKTSVKQKAKSQTGSYASGSSAKKCPRNKWSGRSYTQNIPATLSIKADKACWIRFIGGVGSSNKFMGGKIQNFGQNVRVEKAGNNKVLFRPKMGFRGSETAVLLVDMKKGEKPYRYTLKYKIKIR